MRALLMRVFECKISYSLVSLGEEVRLDRPDKIADYLRSAFDEKEKANVRDIGRAVA